MIAGGASRRVGRVDPKSAWSGLEEESSSCLVDVRTHAEWSFVGVPDLSSIGRALWLVEWKTYPSMAINAQFVEAIAQKIAEESPRKMFFICRSGARSYEAAHAVATALTDDHPQLECFNVEEGFEGDLDERGHRGRANGWKARGLSWRQA